LISSKEILLLLLLYIYTAPAAGPCPALK
jgi:hypothetical protein